MDVEREVQHEPQVIEGEDEIPHQPADRTSYAPGPPRAALWVALAIVVGVIAVVIWAILS